METSIQSGHLHMKVLVTGVCGFAGSTVARALQDLDPAIELFGIDNFIRPGSERNRAPLQSAGVRLYHGDVRQASDLESLPEIDWIIDAAANPSVFSGVDGKSNSRQVVEHNLFGTVNLLEYCKRTGAGFILLSTSRVYSIAALAKLPIGVKDRAFQPKLDSISITGISSKGVSEDFSTASPLSLYDSSKLASEILALEYGDAFHFPVWINRCGVLAGAGQFGRPDQGIFAFWLNAYLRRRPLKYVGFDGQGHQVRDCLHPRDVAAIVWKQMQSAQRLAERIQNISGGVLSAMSLAQLSDWCARRFGKYEVASDPLARPFFRGWCSILRKRCNSGIGSRQFLSRKFSLKSPRMLNYIPIG
jgi:CDP-paratose 2-epimerase